jgi:hypothetical protein
MLITPALVVELGLFFFRCSGWRKRFRFLAEKAKIVSRDRNAVVEN